MDKVIVAIECITYNQKNYIRKCLDGFVMQQTNFPFVAIVHDDASTDGTAQIVEEYAKKYPQIIKPIIEKENQWSKHDGSLGRIICDAIKACSPKYVAICEGDDYWTDPYKLQKQVDAMESDEEISLCYTRSRCFSESRNEYTLVRSIDCVDFRTFLLYDETITLTSLCKFDLFISYYKEFEQQRREWMMGDTPLWLWLSKNGKVKALEDITAVYVAHQGSTSRTATYEQHKRFNKSALDIRLFFIEKFDDCKDLIPYLYDKFYRVNMSDAYDFCKVIECVKNFCSIKKKSKYDYIVILKMLPKYFLTKLRVK